MNTHEGNAAMEIEELGERGCIELGGTLYIETQSV